MDTEYTYYFNTRSEAETALCNIKETAETYVYVTVADLNIICGSNSCYKDSKYGWFEESLKDVYVKRDRYGYVITLPRPIPIGVEETKITYRDYHSKNYNKKSIPEPLCITIHTKEVEDIDATLADTFKYIYTIKDRMVNLTIM